jgi:hypothetical protein
VTAAERDSQDVVREVVVQADDDEPVPGEGEGHKNRARVGSIRPTALLYTGGIGATVDLPHFSVIVRGLEAWDHIYRRRANPDLVVEPRLLDAVRGVLGPSVKELRQPPWQPAEGGERRAAEDLGVPVAVFPQWLRCTGCGLLATVTSNAFDFDNRNPFRPDQAQFWHAGCKGAKGTFKASKRSVLPARYLLACANGHLDEFPYVEWVHHSAGTGWKCSNGAVQPKLTMREFQSNLGPSVKISCRSCGAERSMREAVGTGGEEKLPICRGRHPHLDRFEKCGENSKLMLLGASNQWFPATVSLLVMPTLKVRTAADVAELLRAVSVETLDMATGPAVMPIFSKLLAQLGVDLTGVDDETLWEAVQLVRDSDQPKSEVKAYDPLALLAPEWEVLRDPSTYSKVSEKSAFKVRDRGQPTALAPIVERVVAVDRLKKVNAFVGFTRIDALDRIGDDRVRLAPLGRAEYPDWVPATEDRGEGVFLHVSEELVGTWETKVLQTPQWEAHRAAHARNFKRRLSATAGNVDPASRFAPPRYWALHSLSHLLIREMAMHAGYGSASLTERLYAWRGTDELKPAAGLLVSTTAPDSEGTLGGLVELSDPQIVENLVLSSLRRASRCSSDPICAQRLPEEPEDFLHGAACHFCTFASETSCEKANRFLDRRFVVDLPGSEGLGLFQSLLMS